MGCASSTAGDESSNDPPPGAAVTPTVTLSGPRKQPWLAVQVEAAGGIEAWNKKDPYRAYLLNSLSAMCQATTPEEALVEVFSIMEMGHNLWAYAYMRMLYEKQPEVYYGALLAQPAKLLPVVYTPTVGEACQKFGKMPHYKRGCYISIEDRGRIKETLIGYAQKYMKCEGEKYIVDCVVFSDGGRILGLGDLSAWGMGIPIGKLDLYTVCAGVDPNATIPVILDVGAYDESGNTDKLTVREHSGYTGLKKNRVTHTSEEGTVVNSCYYGASNMIEEFLTAATDAFVTNRGGRPLLQFEDFNSNDAFPLLETYRKKFLTYNDDIQGTAAVAVAGLMGAIKIRAAGTGSTAPLMDELRKGVFLFHGAGSAGLGAAALLIHEAGVPASQVFMTNSRGLIWKSADGSSGSFRNEQQKAFAQVGEPDFDSKDLVTCISRLKPTCLIGAVGRAPGCFDKAVITELCKVNGDARPVVFALSNPKTQAEITADDAYAWSEGKAIYGSGTAFGTTVLNGVSHSPGQVNNFYIFPGMSFGAVACDAKTIPERLFMISADAVANSLSSDDIKVSSVMPDRNRIRDVSLNVATAIVLEATKLNLCNKPLGSTDGEVRAKLSELMWAPKAVTA